MLYRSATGSFLFPFLAGAIISPIFFNAVDDMKYNQNQQYPNYYMPYPNMPYQMPYGYNNFYLQ